MKKYFLVTFKFADGIYCSNLAHAESEEACLLHYADREWVAAKECSMEDVESAKRRGMPLIEL